MKTGTFILCAVMVLMPRFLFAADASKTRKQWQITNEIISVTISARDAGAVCSLVYGGKEFVNDDDHGRQMQVAWIYNDMDEAYNPTEAGSCRDGTGSKTTSQLLSVQIQSNTLRTVNHPAYWRHTDMPEKHRSNTALVTRDTLAKKLTLGHDGNPNVLVFDTVVTISPELTGPPVTSLRIEAPTLYATADLSRHYLFNLASGALTSVPSRSNRKNILNTRISRVTRRNLIPILSSPDGRYSVAFYTPQAENFWAYFTWDVPGICVKVTTFFKHAVKTGQSYSYRNFVIVGDMATVKASAMQLHKRESKGITYEY